MISPTLDTDLEGRSVIYLSRLGPLRARVCSVTQGDPPEALIRWRIPDELPHGGEVRESLARADRLRLYPGQRQDVNPLERGG
ncbi:MAG: hypothetical protein GWM92_15775 [Gemmatimonadetes bacterium]|nr:hypothetical protein [Gemmatimonadota bacterium]NIR80191.1 hypothetical protein [Gemmatimonadota bacterium]NIT88953.1 hypothetical protein [Gemmatimonadota bacterium]NIU32748.1 hypothetical protein [Gemmatimonadota bacterium]NIU37180.1 hypothetical protein [Gemmatimonadota bacterium]